MARASFPHARAVGVSWRAELASGLFAEPALVDVIEVIAERALHQRAHQREACALAEVWPVVPHGVSLSLGSADGVDRSRVRDLARLARAVHAPYVSEHIAFVRAGGVEIGHLTQLPRTREALDVLARNIAIVQAQLPCPLLLENVAWSIRSRDDEMDEATFVNELVQRTGCGLLLDVSNLRANAKNEGLDPEHVLARYPLEAVRMMHVAGARTAEDGFVFDTHADPVDDEAMRLVARALAGTGDVPIILERDRAFPAFSETRGELRALRDVTATPHAPPDQAATPRAPPQRAPPPLGAWQREVARALVDVGAASDGLDARELARARSILARKKRDEGPPRALPRPLSLRLRDALAGALS